MTKTPLEKLFTEAQKVPLSLFQLVNTGTQETVCIIQARDQVEAGVRFLTLLSIYSAAPWLQKHMNAALDVQPHPEFQPRTVPTFMNGWFLAVEPYVLPEIPCPTMEGPRTLN